MLRSSQAGDADAQYNLGVCYDNGDGVAVDKVEAFKWNKLAAEAGHVQALHRGDANSSGVAVDES